MNTKVLTAHVPLPLAEKVDQIAARMERSRGWIMKQALTAWVDQEEERRRMTLEGMADRVKLTATVADTWQLNWWIMSYGDSIEVTAPVALRRKIGESLADAANQYE